MRPLRRLLAGAISRLSECLREVPKLLRVPPQFAFPSVAFEASVLVVPAKQPPDERFGMNCAPQYSPIVKRLGGVWVRNHIPWEQGAADQPRGRKGISSYSLPWASVFDAENDKRNMREFFSPPRPEPWNAYVKYAAAVVKDRVPLFELWNEPNLDLFWRSTPDTFARRVDDYAALLKRSYPLVKQENPKLLVTNGSIVNTRRSSGHDFLEALLKQDCGKSFDILNLHYYRANRAPEAGGMVIAWALKEVPWQLPEGLHANQAEDLSGDPIAVEKTITLGPDPIFLLCPNAKQK